MNECKPVSLPENSITTGVYISIVVWILVSLASTSISVLIAVATFRFSGHPSLFLFSAMFLAPLALTALCASVSVTADKYGIVENRLLKTCSLKIPYSEIKSAELKDQDSDQTLNFITEICIGIASRPKTFLEVTTNSGKHLEFLMAENNAKCLADFVQLNMMKINNRRALVELASRSKAFCRQPADLTFGSPSDKQSDRTA